MRIFLGTGLEIGRPHGGGTAAPGGGAPRPLRPPRITGTGQVGAPLALDPGEWRGAERLAFAWLRDGTPIAGSEGRLAYAPVAADDRAAVAAEVTAHGAAGVAARARTAPITIAFPPPVAIAPERELAYTQTTGTVTLDISSFFNGSSLSFGVVGEGLTIDPATGFVTFDAAALAKGVTLRFVARNSGGEARVDLTLVHAPEAVALPEATVAPRLSGAGRVGEPLVADPGSWTGAAAVALQWLKDGLAIEGATGVEFIPGDAEDGTRIAARATATNAAGSTSAETAAIAVVQAPPALAEALADLVLPVAPGAARIAAAGAFSGRGLRFAVTGAEASVDAATGEIAIPTGAARAAETVTVAASNSGGAAEARFLVRVLAAPTALAAPAATVVAQGTGTRVLEAVGWFSGEDLAFTLEGGPAGASIDAAGRVTLPLAAAWSGEIAVRAANLAGAAAQRAAVRILAAPTALAAPAATVVAQGTGTRVLEAVGWFSGEDLAFTLEGGPAGASIDAAGRVTLPLAAAWSGEIAVRAANLAGAAAQRAAVRILAAPTALAAPAPVTFLQGTAAATVSAQAFFSGAELVFALEGAPAGIAIQAGSGLVSLSADAPLAATFTIRATNAVGSATQRLSVTVAATVSDFAVAAEVAKLPFLYVSAAPSWTAAAGFGRLRPAAEDRAHGDWPLARGDGRYRALARWSMDGRTMTQARAFGLAGRVGKTGSDFRGVQVYALLGANDARQIQIRAYTGSGIGSTILASAASAWAWDVWNWIEVEFEGAKIRGRIFAETAAQPTAWQVTANTAHLAAGGFGPMSQGLNGLAPVADIRRLEYHPLASAAAAPAAAQDADWSLGQTMVKE